jgi:chorismate mutase/prephenate dehydrogenase
LKQQEEFEQLRDKLSEVDDKIVTLIGERQQIVGDIGKVKRSEGRDLRDFKREKVVIEAAIDRARTLGIETKLVEDVVRTLIRYSLANQEKSLFSSVNRGDGNDVLIIGGAGRMGEWFAEMLAAQGFAIDRADKSLADGPGQFSDWHDAGVKYNIIVVATPIGETNQILLDLAGMQPSGLIFDIASLKTPLRQGIQALSKAGCKVASLHPMFGPDTELLSKRHLIFVDAGCPGATAEAKELFSETLADQLDLTLDNHDHLVAYVLGLSHALNVIFFDALRRSGESASELIKMSSTTFDAQLLVSAAVARENPNLYFEIQRLNEYGADALNALCESAEHIRDLVLTGDAGGFVEIMDKGQQYFALRRRPDHETQGQSIRRRKIGD